MNEFYRSIGVTKQAVHQHLARHLKGTDEQEQLLRLVQQIRADHPTMGLRDLYYKIRPSTMGRDKFEEFGKRMQLGSKIRRNQRRTTDSSGVIRFPNLLEGRVLTGINQIWQSDITYFEIGNRFYYLTFIIDAFSRVIVGYSVSSRLLTSCTTLPALQMAIAYRKGMNLDGLILHSDGGGQYYADDFLKYTSQLRIKNSMCEFAWENGKAERINGVIKNNYLVHRSITSYSELVKELDRTVQLYNREKPHIELDRSTPVGFENNYLYNSKKTTRTKQLRRDVRRPLEKGVTNSDPNNKRIAEQHAKIKRSTRKLSE